MHKLVIIGTILVASLCPTGIVAAPVQQSTSKITNTQVVRNAKDKTFKYAGIKMFVPAGQTLMLGQFVNGSVMVRGQNLEGVKIGKGTISALGPVILVVQPHTQVITVVQGNGVRVMDGNGRTAELSKGASVSAIDIRTNVTRPLRPAFPETKDESVANINSNVLATLDMKETTAREQATQDIEETLSPSAVR